MQEQSSNVSLNRVAHRMAMFLCCVLLFEMLLIAIVPRLHSGSVLKIAKDSLLLRARTDSWTYMAQGDLAWRQHPHAIYETVFFERCIRFIYPPTSLPMYRAWQAARFVDLQPFTALKIPLSALPDSKENIRSALNRATRHRGIELSTSSDSEFLYVWIAAE